MNNKLKGILFFVISVINLWGISYLRVVVIQKYNPTEYVGDWYEFPFAITLFFSVLITAVFGFTYLLSEEKIK